MTEKTVLVTGASRGIGRAVALELARQGFAVVAHYRSGEAEARALVAEIEAFGGCARSLGFDVSDRDQCSAALGADIDAHGAYYGVICNAGITRDNAFPALSGDDWDSVLRTNLNSFYNVLQPLVMPMIKLREGGRVVVMTSVSGVIGNRGQVNYSASKAGLIGASKALAVELAKRNISVNCVAPGAIATEILDGAPVDEILKAIPMKRLGRVEEVAATVAFLCSEPAGYITRQVICVNGGLC